MLVNTTSFFVCVNKIERRDFMQKLTSEDISKNKVDTIPQYYILDYLKQNLNINEFKIYLVDRNNIKVVDKNNDSLYFSCEDDTREITYQDEIKEYAQEIEL